MIRNEWSAANVRRLHNQCSEWKLLCENKQKQIQYDYRMNLSFSLSLFVYEYGDLCSQ